MILDLYEFFYNITKFDYDFYLILIYIFIYSIIDIFEDIYLSFLILGNIFDPRYFLLIIPIINIILKYVWTQIRNHIAKKIQEYTLRSTYYISDTIISDYAFVGQFNKSKLNSNIPKIDQILNLGFNYLIQLINLIVSVGFLFATNFKSDHTNIINSIIVLFIPIYYTYRYSYIKSNKLHLKKIEQNDQSMKISAEFFSNLTDITLNQNIVSDSDHPNLKQIYLSTIKDNAQINFLYNTEKNWSDFKFVGINISIFYLSQLHHDMNSNLLLKSFATINTIYNKLSSLLNSINDLNIWLSTIKYINFVYQLINTIKQTKHNPNLTKSKPNLTNPKPNPKPKLKINYFKTNICEIDNMVLELGNYYIFNNKSSFAKLLKGLTTHIETSDGLRNGSINGLANNPDIRFDIEIWDSISKQYNKLNRIDQLKDCIYYIDTLYRTHTNGSIYDIICYHMTELRTLNNIILIDDILELLKIKHMANNELCVYRMSSYDVYNINLCKTLFNIIKSTKQLIILDNIVMDLNQDQINTIMSFLIKQKKDSMILLFS